MAERLKAELTGPYTKRCKGPDILAAQGATHAGQRKANLKSGLIIPRVKQGIGSEIMHTLGAGGLEQNGDFTQEGTDEVMDDPLLGYTMLGTMDPGGCK